jgi:ABC-type branched-subunit amino acid transport system substrate-binding protein
VTGEGASQDGSSPAGFNARIAMQNAEGGIDGHKLVGQVIDDQTNPAGIATAVQGAVANDFAIVSQSPLFFLAAKYPQQAGVPVTGSYDDGPEWGTQPYTNMFASDNGSVNPAYPVNTQIGDFLKAHGATVLGSYGYSISPSSSRAAIGTGQSFEHAGGKVGVLDTTVPFGSVDFTSTALVAKQKNINAMVPALDNNSNYALATSLAQAGVKLKTVLFATGYQPDTVGSPVWHNLQGDYFLSLFRPFSLPNAGTQQMQAALEKYAGFTSSQFPTFGQYEAWAGADLMIKGLLLAGPNPTRSAVIKKLRGVTSYNANGLLPVTFDYSTNFGKNPPKTCAWIMQAETSGFNLTSPDPTCGTDLPHTNTASAS